MNITLVSTGEYPIPPQGYGAIELVIWNLKKILTDKGHRVSIVNVMSGKNSLARRWKIVREIHTSKPDVVHIHSSKYFGLARFFRGPAFVFSDHSPGVTIAGYK